MLDTEKNKIGVSRKISGSEKTRLKLIAKNLKPPPGFGLVLRTAAAGHSLEELQKDLDELLSTWKEIAERARSAAQAAAEGVEGAVPVLLHAAMPQALSVVQDLFNDKVEVFVFVFLVLFCQPGVLHVEPLTGEGLCIAQGVLSHPHDFKYFNHVY